MNRRTYTGLVVANGDNYIKVKYQLKNGKEKHTVVSKTYFDYEERVYKTVGNITGCLVEFDDIQAKIRRVY